MGNLLSKIWVAAGVILLMLCASDLTSQTLTVSTTVTSPSCNGLCNGTATANVSGGAAPYVYSWAPSGTTTSVMTSLCAGNYTVTVMDSTGQTVSAIATIIEPPLMTVTRSQIDPTCNGICNGSATANISGGMSPYSFQWSPPPGAGQGTSAVTGLCVGTYTFYGTDANGCTNTQAFTLLPTSDLTSTITSTPSACGQSNGTATVVVNGTGAPFTYSWSPAVGSGQGTATVTGLAAGNYNVYITNSSGCITSTSVAVANSGGPVVSVVSQVNPTCAGSCNGSATIIASGGTGTYSYSWSPTWGTTPTQNNLCPGAYVVSVTDANGCTGSANVYITQPVSIQATTQATNTLCTANTGTIMVTLSGGKGSYTYSWDYLTPGASGQGTGNVGNLTQGCYTVTVTDSLGCSNYGTACVSAPPTPYVDINTYNLHCYGLNNGSMVARVSGGTLPYLYSWSNGATSDTIANLASATYTVTVTDVNGCTSGAIASLLPVGHLFLALNSTPSNCSNTGTAFVTALQGGSTPYTYSWSSIPSQNTATASSLSPGSYHLLVTDSNGCSATGSTQVYSQGCKSVIKGRIFNDVNNNCIQDSGETGLPYVEVYSLVPYSIAMTDINGDYTLLTDSLQTTIQVNFPSHYTTTCQNMIPTISLAHMGDTSLNNNFALGPPVGFDLALHPGWHSAAHPGFTKEYWIFYYNQSTLTQNGVVTFRYDSNLVFNSATQSPVLDSAHHTLTWNLPNIQPSQCCMFGTSQQLHIYFTIPSTLPLSYNLRSHFEIDPMAGDYDPYNNTLDADEPITGSHDPNLLSVMPAGANPNGGIMPKDSVLFYNINFQNSGTDTAFTVVVKDTLSPYLDPASFQPGASSSPCTISMSNDGTLSWRFDRILLPDSTVNNAGSNGFVNFSVKLRKGLLPGTVITNRADVFFDFNAAVLTNTTVNTLLSPTLVETYSLNNTGIYAYPNPFEESTTLVLSGPSMQRQFVLYDLLGQEMKHFSSNENMVIIHKESLSSGIYLLKVYGENGASGEVKLIVK